MTSNRKSENQNPNGPHDLGQISAKRAKPKCASGRMEHTWEPDWKGSSFDYFKCRFCGKREPV